jgi:Phage endonuclease I
VPEALLIQAKYRNGLEKRIGEQLNKAGVSFDYEPRTIPVAVPARKATYLPDFWINGKGVAASPQVRAPYKPIIIETKGYFYNGAKDRQKLILIKEQHPELDIRLVFSDASKRIYKNSPTTYGKWATDHGFKWADKGIVPDEWLKEMKGTKHAERKV